MMQGSSCFQYTGYETKIKELLESLRVTNLTVGEHQLKYFLPLGANILLLAKNFAALW
jgi:hypothetical protein